MAPKKKTTKKANTGNQLSYEDLIEQGQVAMGKFQPELACEYFSRALKLRPDDCAAMDMLSEAYLSIGEQEKAYNILLKSISKAPEDNPFKWFSFAQLQSGTDALMSLNQGINILVTKTLPASEESERSSIKKDIAKGYCTIADLFLTDLCYDEGAESNCEVAVMQALQWDPQGLDGLLALASLRLSQNRSKDAGDVMTSIFDKVMHLRNVTNSRTIVEELSSSSLPDEVTENPDPEFCISIVKRLLECGYHDHSLVEKAYELASDLLKEDDENTEIWCLIGVASMAMQPPDLESARYHLEQAQQILENQKTMLSKEEYNEEKKVIDAHFAQLETALQSQGTTGSDEHGENGQEQQEQQEEEMELEEDEEWSDVDSSEEQELV